MKRWAWFLICSLLGLVMLLCGWLVPQHLRAVDASVLRQAGRKTPALTSLGLALLNARNVGAAQLVVQAARASHAPGRDQLEAAVAEFLREQPRVQVLGTPDPYLERLLGVASRKDPAPAPLTELVLRLESRDDVMARLQASRRPVVRELLRLRELTNTVIFPPSHSASGQALDAALSTTGLLLEGEYFSRGLTDRLYDTAAQANRGGNPLAIEQLLLDAMSLGQRLSWSQLAALVQKTDDAETLRLLTHFLRKADGHLPALYAAVLFTGKSAAVGRYLLEFSQTGLEDLSASLAWNVGAVNELLERNQRLYRSAWRDTVVKYNPFGAFYDFAVDYAWLMPGFTLGMKWLFYVAAGFLLAMAVHHLRRVPALERPLQVRGFHYVREFLFGLGFLVMVLLLSEPFLAQDSQKVESPFRLRLPTVDSVLATGSHAPASSFMNQLSLLTLLLFFVLQALIYTACLIKLAEIRRQTVPPRIKLKLLENEDHLFDAGLYLGFVGTIISLILVSLGVIKPSLMAAYSSTSFGIIFVSIFKIFHLRPLRRKLLLEAEAVYPDPAPAVAASTLATSS